MELEIIKELKAYFMTDTNRLAEINKEKSELRAYILQLIKICDHLADIYYATQYITLKSIAHSFSLKLPSDLSFVTRENPYLFFSSDVLREKLNDLSKQKEASFKRILQGQYQLEERINICSDMYGESTRAHMRGLVVVSLLHCMHLLKSVKLFYQKRYGDDAGLDTEPNVANELMDTLKTEKNSGWAEKIEREVKALNGSYKKADDISNTLSLKTLDEIRERDFPRHLFWRAVGKMSVLAALSLLYCSGLAFTWWLTEDFYNKYFRSDVSVQTKTNS